jgi:hypothetical protein
MKFDLHKTLALINLFAPLVLANVKNGDKIGKFIPIITDGIVAAEQIKGATGAEKKAHVLEIVTAAVSGSNATGKTAIDEHAVTTAAGAGIDAVISTIHAIEGGKVVKPSA